MLPLDGSHGSVGRKKRESSAFGGAAAQRRPRHTRAAVEPHPSGAQAAPPLEFSGRATHSAAPGTCSDAQTAPQRPLAAPQRRPSDPWRRLRRSAAWFEAPKRRLGRAAAALGPQRLDNVHAARQHRSGRARAAPQHFTSSAKGRRPRPIGPWSTACVFGCPAEDPLRHGGTCEALLAVTALQVAFPMFPAAPSKHDGRPSVKAQ